MIVSYWKVDSVSEEGRRERYILNGYTYILMGTRSARTHADVDGTARSAVEAGSETS